MVYYKVEYLYYEYNNNKTKKSFKKFNILNDARNFKKKIEKYLMYYNMDDLDNKIIKWGDDILEQKGHFTSVGNIIEVNHIEKIII
ncbi:hypothetical protein [Trichloromonas sp.]|uniref:hypothetical protein n=1 Tax=Trichloromonas sp. TaxID=3069249 RepID=UPI002A3B2F36|nr:hypothetical protein [Trichloromonas sp.]